MSPTADPTAIREPAGLVVETGTPYSEMATAPLYPLLTSASIVVSRTEAAEATLVFESRREPDGTWAVQDAGVFRDWTRIRLRAVFGALRSEEILRGYVREVKVSHPENVGESQVTVIAQDHSLAADRQTRRRAWGRDVPTTDSLILAEILPRYQLGPAPNSAAGRSGLVLNQDATDAAFLRSRAEANGYDLLYEGGTVYFGPARLSTPEQAPIRVAAGQATNCTQVDIETDGRKPDAVVVQFASGTGSSATTREVRVEPDLPLLGLVPITSPDAGLGDNVEYMSGQAGDEEDALRHTAQVKANELAWKTTATGTLDGTAYGHVLRVGRTVRLDGVGITNSGTHLVDKVTHTFDGDGYRQQFTLLRNATGDDGFGALLPGAGSLASVFT